MLSYRHAFHAGNHADILKHSLLSVILESLQKKDKPYTLIDTHAGAGVYVLDDERALKTGEAEQGIIRLLQNVEKTELPQAEMLQTVSAQAEPIQSQTELAQAELGQSQNPKVISHTEIPSEVIPTEIIPSEIIPSEIIPSEIIPSEIIPSELIPYINLCKKYKAQGKYPGSPEIFSNYLRKNDKAILVELHNTEIEILQINMKKNIHDGRISIHHRDAYTAIDALTPPDPRRGLLLMDPSYEVDNDYDNVVEALRLAHKKWPVGILCLWYPLLKHRESELAVLKDSLKSIAEGCGKDSVSWYCAELLIEPEDKEVGLYGSGMFVLNPTWQIDTQMEHILPYLVSILGGCEYRVQKDLK